jgi:hypothetical protein
MTQPLARLAQDPMIAILDENCFRQQGNLRIRYKMWIELKSFSGIRPEFEGDIVSKCPFTRDEFAAQVLPTLGSGAADAFRDILGNIPIIGNIVNISSL